jgi:hypothetical protein
MLMYRQIKRDCDSHVNGARVSPQAQPELSFLPVDGMRLSSVPSSIHPLEAV